MRDDIGLAWAILGIAGAALVQFLDSESWLRRGRSQRTRGPRLSDTAAAALAAAGGALAVPAGSMWSARAAYALLLLVLAFVGLVVVKRGMLRTDALCAPSAKGMLGRSFWWRLGLGLSMFFVAGVVSRQTWLAVLAAALGLGFGGFYLAIRHNRSGEDDH